MNASAVSPNIPRMNVSRNLTSMTNNLSNATSSVSSFFASWYGLIAAVLILMVLMAIYYQTIGYYINIGWNKLMWSHDRGEKIKIEVPGSDISAELKPAATSTLSSVESGIESAVSNLESDVATALGSGHGKNQVFNVSRNLYTFGEAEPLCRAYGAELATYDQIKEAHAAGADWCNYGWSKGQLALYPTSKENWEKLQKGPEHERMSCGRPGVNGGHFPNAEQRFGVNCYGPRPAESALDQRLQEEERTDTKFDREVMHFKDQLDSIAVNPWSSKQWSA
jgi:hypothetical protein